MGLAHGIHGWTDVAVPDMEAGRAFYTGLFGWHASDGGGGDAMPYTMFTLDGKLVAGLGGLSPEQAATGQPPVWSAYIIVDDLDEVFARAIELGAKPLMEPTQIMEAGKMAFMLDPVGAAIGFWEPGIHGGAEVFNLPGTVTWNDLGCRDVEAAKSFYGDLLGWEATAIDMGGGATYWTFTNAGRANGGVWDINGAMPDEMPAHWLNWFRVDDCAATAARAVELGGSIEREPSETGIGVMAVVSDPFGAVFAVIETDQVDGQPPR
jgi:predicted enzyme related to lactoylglutathione lyase